jgi:hypothetical protein
VLDGAGRSDRVSKGGGGGLMIKPPYLPPWAPRKLNIFTIHVHCTCHLCISNYFGAEVHLQGGEVSCWGWGSEVGTISVIAL